MLGFCQCDSIIITRESKHYSNVDEGKSLKLVFVFMYVFILFILLFELVFVLVFELVYFILVTQSSSPQRVNIIHVSTKAILSNWYLNSDSIEKTDWVLLSD